MCVCVNTTQSDDLSCGACHDSLPTGCPFRGCKRCVFLLCLPCCRERAAQQSVQSPTSSSSSSAADSHPQPVSGAGAAPMQEVSQGLDELLALIGLPSLFGTHPNAAGTAASSVSSDGVPSAGASMPSAEKSPPLPPPSESGNFFDGVSTSLFGSPITTNTNTTTTTAAGTAESRITIIASSDATSTTTSTKTPTTNTSRSRGAQPRSGRSASPRASHPHHPQPAKRTPVSARRSTISGSMPTFSFGFSSSSSTDTSTHADGGDHDDNNNGEDGDGYGEGSTFTSPFASSIGNSLGAIGNFFSPTSTSSSSSSSSSARRASRTLQPLARSPRAGSPRAGSAGSGVAAATGGASGPGRRGKGGSLAGGGVGSLRPSSSVAERKQDEQAHAKEVRKC